jgi:hypothetical protein
MIGCFYMLILNIILLNIFMYRGFNYLKRILIHIEIIVTF